jgi:hypothetical protein
MCGVEVQLVMTCCEVVYVNWDCSMRHGHASVHARNQHKEIKKAQRYPVLFVQSSGKDVYVSVGRGMCTCCTTMPRLSAGGACYGLCWHLSTKGWREMAKRL